MQPERAILPSWSAVCSYEQGIPVDKMTLVARLNALRTCMSIHPASD